MPRKSKIEQLGIGDKIVGYSVSGMNGPQIINKIALEHAGVTINQDQIDRYLHTRQSLISKENALARNNAVEFTLTSVHKAMTDTMGEIKQYLDKFSDNPRAAPQLLRVKVDALDKLVKMLGGYAPESQVNVQVNVANTKESFELSLKESEKYFKTIEAGAVDGSANP